MDKQQGVGNGKGIDKENDALEQILGLKEEEAQITAPFNYLGLEEEKRGRVQQKAEEIKSLVRRSLTDLLQIGKWLIEVKEDLEHGQFGEWLSAEFAWTSRTARYLMNAARTFKTEEISNLKIVPSAMLALSSPELPEEARQEAITRAQEGERINVEKAREIVAKHRTSDKDESTERIDEQQEERASTIKDWTKEVEEALTSFLYEHAKNYRATVDEQAQTCSCEICQKAHQVIGRKPKKKSRERTKKAG
ncbi:DUF3102 domain-containing protein [Anthocerotibacter panamensis]|uniref:DUF3102 domain-containing protein n=1 Tax=Anthocerotibacter panamensis TaxID=2857077 RepID=UPI001C4062E9|nr:DUF3102 domain-containing protein [Anthocerotibacter panamensis]